MRQLPLDLALPPRLERADFLRAPANAAALDLVDAWPAWPDPTLLLLGAPGAGKSHLGAIWAARAGAVRLRPEDLRAADLPGRLGPAALLDDADAAAAAGEAPLFHLLNLVREQGASLLMTARTPPDRWGLHTPDLLSRLRLAPAVALAAPDDALLRAVLAKLLADRQLVVDEAVVTFLVLRLERSLAAVRAVVDALDRAALAGRRAVTRPLAAEVLAGLVADEDGAPV